VLRRSGAAIVGLLLAATVGHAQAIREAGGDEILAYVAKIQAMVAVCRQQTPAVAEHVVRTYAEWLERNPVISETLHGLDFGPDPARMGARTAALAEMRRQEVTTLQRALGMDPAGFSMRCERFLRDLDLGELDYPAASTARRE
jgi:hypothetical protein